LNIPDKQLIQPDFRTLLYWKPGVNPVDFAYSFYTSDHRSAYIILFNGIDNQGRKLTGTAAFTVK
jgi:hypothetical protein